MFIRNVHCVIRVWLAVASVSSVCRTGSANVVFPPQENEAYRPTPMISRPIYFLPGRLVGRTLQVAAEVRDRSYRIPFVKVALDRPVRALSAEESALEQENPRYGFDLCQVTIPIDHLNPLRGQTLGAALERSNPCNLRLGRFRESELREARAILIRDQEATLFAFATIFSLPVLQMAIWGAAHNSVLFPIASATLLITGSIVASQVAENRALMGAPPPGMPWVEPRIGVESGAMPSIQVLYDAEATRRFVASAEADRVGTFQRLRFEFDSRRRR